MKIDKYSIGIGDRFHYQGEALLKALIKAKEIGLDFVPVFNKSNREHSYIGTTPYDTRKEADEAVKKVNWKANYFVDADHINLKTVDKFIDASDFFTLDVADYIGQKADDKDIAAFLSVNQKYIGTICIPSLNQEFTITESKLKEIGEKFLYAIQEAGKIYRHIVRKKGTTEFITEVSMDEVDLPQTPIELFFILSACANEQIPLQTIAPRFTGRFNKGVEWQGDIKQFEKEFEEDLLVIDYAINEFNLPENLKLSVHSGSDKFLLYPVIGRLIKKYDKGIHIKTAGTTWCEEVAALASADNAALAFVKKVFSYAYEHFEELCLPYSAVISIDKQKLPLPNEFETWGGTKVTNSIRHIQTNPDYNMNIRQLIHVAYKVAAENSTQYNSLLEKHADEVGQAVTENIFNRHLCKLKNN
jgi:hypothetical protein